MRFPLFFGICFFFLSENIVEGRHLRCFKDCDQDFSKAHKKLLHALLSSPKHAPHQAARHSADSCEAFIRASSQSHLSDRSLSPWRTRIVKNPNLYPPSYEEAECLCDGCIINGVENRTYNSVPVQRTRLFLKKVPCPSDPKKYSFEYENVLVTVACTCAVPRQ